MNRTSIVMALLLSALALSCGKDDAELMERNLPPQGFRLIILTLSATSMILDWTEAVDPEGEPVVYDVFLDNAQVSENQSSREFIFNDLVPDTNYTVGVVAKDERGAIHKEEISFTTPG